MTDNERSEIDGLIAAFGDIAPDPEESERALERVRQALIEQANRDEADRDEKVVPVTPRWWRTKMNTRSYIVVAAVLALMVGLLASPPWHTNSDPPDPAGSPLVQRLPEKQDPTLAEEPGPASRDQRGLVHNVLFVAEGGRLDALDEARQLVGPCPLKHTDVDVQIAGHFSRVTVTQHYQNPYEDKIEAVYTFPLSHRAAVDRMTMAVGDRVVQGEVKERERARQIYQAARQQGHVASLLEQERPNIFTQSVANIEPGAELTIEISYVETVESVDGQYRFEFPMVVAPRYIPGQPTGVDQELPPGVELRRGTVLLGPAEIQCPDGSCPGLSAWLPQHARPIADTSPAIAPERRSRSDPRYSFQVAYADGLKEPGVIFDDGLGHVGGRWFFCPPKKLPEPGEPFSPDTDQVPDASRITPMPVRPEQRAGHDIAVRVTLDTGGPKITHLESAQHAITGDEFLEKAEERPRRATVALKNENEIPNRDFLLTWRQTGEAIAEATFTHTGQYGDFSGGFFTLVLQPPERIADEDVRPRELIFVLDNSGSMRGFSIESAKKVISQAIGTMRPNDRFNIISFNNTLDVLWPQPQPNTAENRTRAQRYIDERQGGGGTEMRNAVFKALEAGPFAPDTPATEDGGQPMRIVLFVTDGLVGNDDQIIQAVRDNSHRSRMFTIGMSRSPNRYLLDEMARAGRGAVDYALPHEDVGPVVQRFADRIATPVLTDIELDFSDGLHVFDVLPSQQFLPDLFDVQPLVIHGRYTKPGSGTLTIRGRTGAGPYQRTIDLKLPKQQDQHSQIATLWARQSVAERIRQGERKEVVALGEAFQISTQYTSFVAVEKSRVTSGGKPILVPVPIEFPQDMSWEGIFGGDPQDPEVVKKFAQRLGGGLHASQWQYRSEGQGQQGQGQHRFHVRESERSIMPPSRFGARGRPAPQPEAEFSNLRLAESEEARLSEPALPGGSGMGGMAGMGGGVGGMGGVGFGDVEQGAHGGRRRNRGSRADPGFGDVEQGAHGGRALFFSEDKAFTGGSPVQPLDEVPGLGHDQHGLVVVFAGGNSREVASELDQLFQKVAEQEDQPSSQPLARATAEPDRNYLFVLMARPLQPLLTPYLDKLAAEELSSEQRGALFEKLAQELAQQAPSIRHQMRLRGVLDEPLLELLANLDEAQADPERMLGVTVLLKDLEPATLQGLRHSGLTLDDTVRSASFVVGQVRLAELEQLAQHSAVRRIEQIR